MPESIGSILTLSDDLVEKLGEADEKLKSIQTTAQNTQNVVEKAFQSMANGSGLTSFNAAIASIVTNIGAIGTASEAAANKINNIKVSDKGLGSIGSQASGAVSDVTSLTVALDGITKAINGMTGTTLAPLVKQVVDLQSEVAVLQQKLNSTSSGSGTSSKSSSKAVSYDDAMNNAANVSSLNDVKNAIMSLKTARKQLLMTDTDYAAKLTNLNNEIARLSALSKQATMSTEQQAAAAEKAAAAAEKAAAAAEKRARAEYDARAKQYQAQNYAANTTYEGAMSFAENANTINRRAVAVQYLTEARKKLSTTDADYTTKLAALNAKIKELNAENNAAVASSKNLASAHRSLMDIGGQLARQFALVFSVSQIQGYVKKVRDVRGEFEMTQRSLQALLGNKYEADAIFNKTVALAVQSPYKIRDLVKYTRQLAAYRIENDKLYDTTKRLADVAAGLGVDMQRLILAYGQVKAAAFLKGTEVRQFTEAGVNIYSELQEYFKEEKGLDYTTGEIVKMISAKKITFEDVEAIFQRMTDKGGMFYNMQLIQAETLQGKIMKFQDSIDVMLNDIGKSMEGVYKGFYDTATLLMKHWKAFVPIIVMATVAVGGHALALTRVGTLWNNARVGVTKYIAGIKAATGATATLSAAWNGLNSIMKWSVAGAALTVILGIIGSIIQANNEYKASVNSANKEYYDQLSVLQSIINKYRELKELQGEGGEGGEEGEEGEEQDTTEGRRTQLEKLIKQMQKTGYKTDIIPSLINEDELDSTFEEVSKKFQVFLNRLNKQKLQMAGNNIKDDFEDYTDAAEAFAGTYTDIDDAINKLVANYDNLSDSQKAMLDEITDGGDGSLEYYAKALDYVIKINQELGGYRGSGVKSNYKEFVEGSLKNSLKQYRELSSAYKEAHEKAIENYDKTFSDIAKDAGLTEKEKSIQIKAMIDMSEWDDFGKDLLRKIAEEEYGIKVKMDEDAAADATNYIEEYFNKWFADHDFTIRIRAGEFDTDPLDALMDSSKSMQKSGKDVLARLRFLEGMEEGGTKSLTRKMMSDKGLLGDTSWANWIAKVLGAAADATKIDELPISGVIGAYQKNVDAIEANINRVGLSLYDNKKKTEKANDPLQERLRLLSEMNERYEQLIELMSEADARESTMTAFGDAIKTAGLGQFIGSDFTPDKEGLIGAYTKLLPTAGDKKGDVQKEIGELRVEINQETLTKSIEEAKSKVEAAFDELDLYKTLLDSGVSIADIEKSFGTLPKSYTDVADIIEQEMGGKEGTKWEDTYKEQKAKLDKQIAENTIREYTEIFKNYGERLSEQLQLDQWYAKERKKIEENDKYKSNPKLQNLVLGNLDKEYNQKTSENKWTEFKSSDLYLEVFDNVGEQSIGMINTVLARLETMKGSLKDLSPASVRAVTKAMQDLKDELRDRSPFAALGIDFMELSKGKDEIKKAKEELASASAEKEVAQNTVEERTEEKVAAEADLQTAEQSDDIEAIANAKTNLLKVEESLNAAETSLAAATQKESNAQDNLRIKQQQYNSSLRSMATDISKSVSSLTSLGNSVKSLGNAFGKDWGGLEDAMDLLDGVADFTNTVLNSLADIGVNICGTIQDTVDAVAAGTTASATSAATSISTLEKASAILTIIAAAIQLATIVVGLFNNDESLEKKIKNLKSEVENLERAFEKLEDAMTNALSTSDISSNYEEGIANLKEQIADYEEMIELEKKKKDTDKDAIEEYEDAIEDLQDELEDYYNSYLEMLGGISTDDYRSAAEEFAEAWIEAFNETEDTFEALTDNLQDYLDNMLKQMVTSAASEKFLQPIFDNLNDLVTSAGDITGLSEAALNEWWDESEDLLEQYNEFLEEYFEKLGISPSSSSDSSLSSLQQGIQSITEETGAALESLLNSMRFYLATQQADVAIIKTTLIGMAGGTYSDSTSASNPTVVELKAQTSLLQSIDKRLSSVIVMGHPKGGSGLKVFA